MVKSFTNLMSLNRTGPSLCSVTVFTWVLSCSALSSFLGLFFSITSPCLNSSLTTTSFTWSPWLFGFQAWVPKNKLSDFCVTIWHLTRHHWACGWTETSLLSDCSCAMPRDVNCCYQTVLLHLLKTILPVFLFWHTLLFYSMVKRGYNESTYSR